MEASTHWFGPLETRLVDSHVHAMAHGPLIQVVSSDRHTVKPWFQGKLSYAPPVQAKVGPDCVLNGARTEALRGEATAVLVYTCHRHVASLFIWPNAQQQMPASLQIRGFHLQRWSDGAMQYWLVSDMDMQAIEQFGQAWRNPVAAARPASAAPP
jgi:anti-sigma factor RsiW